ncbi:MAG TPA: helix-turn-helix transcriptional regulator [Ktedonobacterales bacterium]|jgi:DNA-binding PadR family transcriptional regulator
MRELKKGSLGLLLLHLLQARPSYGYELCERLRDQSGGTLSFEDGAIYPLLHEFERQGLVEASWEEAGAPGLALPTEAARRGPRRRYYRMTPRGQEALQAALSEWHLFARAVARVLGEAPGVQSARIPSRLITDEAAASGGRR